jgi:hypothetical protein
VDLAPAEHVAALIAPVIDRLRIAIASSVAATSSDLAGAFGLDERGMRTIAMLRNTMPDRHVTRDQLGAVFQYTPSAAVDAGAQNLTNAGVVEATDGTIHLTDRGRELIAQLYVRTTEFLVPLWAPHADRLERLADLAQRALDAATSTGGDAFGVMSPPYEPPGAAPAMLLAERLTPLRFHRFDAHIAAWRSEGLAVEEVQGLAPGPQRDRIEAETNRRAAAPYAALTEAERLELLGGLGALRG